MVEIKKRRVLLIFMAIIIITVVITPVIYVQVNKYKYADRVTNYLLEEEKYSREEIESVKGVWGKKLPSFYTLVIFKDEPYVEYVYFAHSEIIQFDYRLTEEGEEKGVAKSKLKHYVPHN
ncbi:DUF3139 domain-containing protein [Paenibacillus gallinarum]|uniref:DUF3139 domain-containing protein n=1 Tax=Paenibacillus gallinarum TaxID=2762232 RepID=A0ABR8STP6_9BACL|nr:DUF3139 domain-containing protein [Paenibacillus gallinarum]MBD7966718.1 DUF3139 domain-containing protein [Paenibacillus gallinarum]